MYIVKTVVIGSQLVNGSVMTEKFTTYPIVGEILKIRVDNPISPGSLFFAESGGNLAIVTYNNLTSGNKTVEWYPRQYTVENIGNAGLSVGSPSISPFVAAPVSVGASGLTSGTGKYIGPITIYYR